MRSKTMGPLIRRAAGVLGPAMVLMGLCFGLSGLFAQEADGGTPVDEASSDLEELKSLAPALVLAKEDLEEARSALEGASTEEEKAELEAKVDTQRVRVAELKDDFRTLASGIEEARYLGTEPESLSLQENLEDILAPISRGVREATEEPRELDELRRKLEVAEEHLTMSNDALRRLTKLIDLAETQSILEELGGAKEMWSKRLARALSQKAVLEQQISKREGGQKTTFERLSEFFQEFWRSRGLNLVLAILVAVGSGLLVKRGYRLVKRMGRGKKQGGIATRSLDLAVEILAVLAAVGGLVLVFYLRGDWLMLALTILALLGILWASKEALPPYLNQMKLILNLGSVREGERLLFNGIPWRVKRLNFQCHFDNPELTGGKLRLPIRDVMPLCSREADSKEPWFPSRKDDWVMLSDDTYGKVIEQTPEQVVVLRLGGSLKTYPTVDYLALAPENLSRGYRIQVEFGIAYAYQQISTTEVPKAFQEVLEGRLLDEVGKDGLSNVNVEFISAAASSLNYVVLADFDGSLGSRRNALNRLINSICVDVCNERGWEIPFQQITLHQAADS